MLVRVKCWLKANGVWNKPGAEIEVDSEAYESMSENVDIIKSDEPKEVPAATEAEDALDGAKAPTRRPGRSKKSK